MGLGTNIREVYRAPGGKRIAAVVEVVEYELDGGSEADYRRTTGSRSDHARAMQHRYALRFRLYSQPAGMMRIAQPMSAMVKRQFDKHCANLKWLLETSPTA
jgi:hypothetical protein